MEGRVGANEVQLLADPPQPIPVECPVSPDEDEHGKEPQPSVAEDTVTSEEEEDGGTASNNVSTPGPEEEGEEANPAPSRGADQD